MAFSTDTKDAPQSASWPRCFRCKERTKVLTTGTPRPTLNDMRAPCRSAFQFAIPSALAPQTDKPHATLVSSCLIRLTAPLCQKAGHRCAIVRRRLLHSGIWILHVTATPYSLISIRHRMACAAAFPWRKMAKRTIMFPPSVLRASNVKSSWRLAVLEITRRAVARREL